MVTAIVVFDFFFFNDTATTEIYTLSLHDALPISATFACSFGAADVSAYTVVGTKGVLRVDPAYEYATGLQHHLDIRSEEHTSELQSQSNLVCRLLLEKKR